MGFASIAKREPLANAEDATMSKQIIGPRELALRAQREAASKPMKSVRELAAALPVTSDIKSIKRKRKAKR